MSVNMKGQKRAAFSSDSFPSPANIGTDGSRTPVAPGLGTHSSEPQGFSQPLAAESHKHQHGPAVV